MSKNPPGLPETILASRVVAPIARFLNVSPVTVQRNLRGLDMERISAKLRYVPTAALVEHFGARVMDAVFVEMGYLPPPPARGEVAALAKRILASRNAR